MFVECDIDSFDTVTRRYIYIVLCLELKRLEIYSCRPFSTFSVM